MFNDVLFTKKHYLCSRKSGVFFMLKIFLVMFKYTYFFIFAALLYSCAPDAQQNTPEEAAKHFFEELSKLNFEVAELYATEKTKKSLNFIRTELKMSNPTEQNAIKASFQLNFKTIKCAETDGETACQLCCGIDSSEATVQMVQKDKKWFVHWER